MTYEQNHCVPDEAIFPSGKFLKVDNASRAVSLVDIGGFQVKETPLCCAGVIHKISDSLVGITNTTASIIFDVNNLTKPLHNLSLKTVGAGCGLLVAVNHETEFSLIEATSGYPIATMDLSRISPPVRFSNVLIGWKAPKIPPPSEIQEQVNGCLKRLSEKTFDAISSELARLHLPGVDMFESVVLQIYNEGILGSHRLYARLCAILCENLFVPPDLASCFHSTPELFRKVLLDKCSREFEFHRQIRQPPSFMQPGQLTILNGWSEYHKIEYNRLRRRNMSHIAFMCELLKSSLLPGQILYDCMERLLNSTPNKPPAEKDVEAVCLILSRVGKTLDSAENEQRMDAQIGHMSALAALASTPPTIKTMIRSTIQLRANNWRQHRHHHSHHNHHKQKTATREKKRRQILSE
ncbi:Eukaryotic translation initiation factor 4G [Pelomyxa schiedti]|nr:Eukaryotic translation initiation factor 4G [Pelomyxa schiedti]